MGYELLLKKHAVHRGSGPECGVFPLSTQMSPDWPSGLTPAPQAIHGV